jgi:hypothetical protein
MQITIRAVLGIERADLNLSPLVLLAGVNGAGKSSTLTAAAAALTGQTMPGGILKKDSRLLVRDGSDGGRVTVKDGDGQVSVSWPAAECATEGRSPAASPIAVGLTSLLDMDVKTRAQALDRLLKASPSLEDLAVALRDSDGRFVSGGGMANEQEAAAMEPLGLDPKDQRDAAIFRIVQKIGREIEVNGFDGAHAQAKNTGTELKGAWRQVTGEVYGSDKAAKWQHKDVSLVDELVPEGKEAVSHLTAQVEHFKHFAEVTARNAAVAAADLDGTRAKAARVPELEQAEREAKKKVDETSDAHTALMVKMPPLPPTEPMVCPHCSNPVAIEDGALVAVSHAPDPAEVAAAREKRASHEEKVAEAKAVFEATYADHKTLERELVEARTAARKLGETTNVPAATEEDVAKAKETVARHERALVAAKQKHEADKLHRHATINQVIIDILAPEGLRKAKLAKVLESFNQSRLLPLCQAAGWKPVEIGADMEIRFAGRLAREPFVSESQVLRAKIILQVAIAQLDGSACVLIDRADKLDPAGRNGLFTMLNGEGIKAVVAMTYGKPALVPDLAKAGWGHSIWIARGVAQPLDEVMAALQQPQAAE